MCRWLLRRASPRDVGLLFEQLQIDLAGNDPRVGQYMLDCNNPQTLCFLIDCYPVLQRIFSRYQRTDSLRVLDIGPAFGASAGLLSQMHRSDFLGPKLCVDALDIVDSRRRLIEMAHPHVNFIHESIDALPENMSWDVVYCSNAIEHIDDPRQFIRAVLKHTRGYAVFLAPYMEQYPLSLDHRGQISEETFAGFAVDSFHTFDSAAWPATADGVLRKQLCAVLRAEPGTSDSDRAVQVAAHWDRWQSQQQSNSNVKMTDWGDHPEVLRLIAEKFFGDRETSLMDFLKAVVGSSGGHALSLCCGDGAFEKSLIQHDVFRSIEGVDLAAARVEAASASARECPGRLSFRVDDVESADFGAGRFDTVIAKSSLHHLSRLEEIFEAIARCLKPGGRLVTIDFFGPSRYQWTDRQLLEINRFLDEEVPERFRRRADGSLYRATRPTVDEMIAFDPSEAIRSGDLYALLAERFEFERDVPLGGTLLSLILHGEIVNNFDPSDSEGNAVIRKAFDLEHRLIDQGALGSDFRLIVARPRPRPAIQV